MVSRHFTHFSHSFSLSAFFAFKSSYTLILRERCLAAAALLLTLTDAVIAGNLSISSAIKRFLRVPGIAEIHKNELSSSRKNLTRKVFCKVCADCFVSQTKSKFNCILADNLSKVNFTWAIVSSVGTPSAQGTATLPLISLPSVVVMTSAVPQATVVIVWTTVG
jgi:hypothetical protein